MSDFFASQMDNLDDDNLPPMIASGLAVASADGALDESELEELAGSIVELTNDTWTEEVVAGWISDGIEDLASNGQEAVLARAGEAIEDEDLREVALLLASAIAWSCKGVNVKEGLALQKLAKHLGIAEKRYFELLGEGKTLVDA